MKTPELLAPAGTLEKLRIAVRYGADAVYLGGEAFGLRSMAGNFSLADMREGLKLCHDNGVKAYLTVNSYPPDHLLEQLEAYLHAVAELPFDAYIVADPGVIRMVRRISPQREIHLSTQANTINREAVLFWQEQGIARVNLAREMTLDDIRATTRACTLPCEVFVHGALCIAYSGRCLLSSAMTGRSANLGSCTQPCRWRYTLQEETRPGEYLPIEEDHNGTFIFNSKDLCLLEQLPELVQAGVAALKIEGRMKGIHYLAGVLRVYRTALDRYAADPDSYRMEQGWLEELMTVSHRGYTTGFLFGAPRDVAQSYDSAYQRSHQVVGLVTACRPDGAAELTVRNRFSTGECLELVGPSMKTIPFTAGRLHLRDPEGNLSEVTTVHPNQTVTLDLPAGAQPDDLLRRPESVPEP